MEKTFPALFERHAALTPEAVAVQFRDQKLSYSDLNSRANQLAHWLITRGYGPEDIIAFALPRSPEMLVVVLGIMKSGAAYLPLDPSYPQDRLTLMLNDSRAGCLLTIDEIGNQLQFANEHICLKAQNILHAIDQAATSNPTQDIRTAPLLATSPGYIIYTSGSTGTPKGVVVTHAGVANLALTVGQRLSLDGSSRVLQFASISFDASMFELCMALLNGARLVLAQAAELLPGERLVDLIQNSGVTHAGFTPSVLAMLPYRKLSKLRTLVVYGEVCQPQLVEQWTREYSLFNGYGPTESTVCATLGEVFADDAEAPPLGGTVEGTQVYVLDRQLNPVAENMTGEIYIAGTGLARGYLGRPGLTAERFIANPFGTSGSRMYRTGDLVMRQADGHLSFVCRSDDQVKIRGFRVELGEVEAMLSLHPEVTQAAVITRRNPAQQLEMVAYVVASTGSTIDSTALRHYLAERVPEHMLPSMLVLLPSFPIGPTGKLDREALPTAIFKSGGSRQAPSLPLEISVAEIFANILGLEQSSIGVHDNFLDLGGNSLTALQLVNRIRSELGLAFELEQLFDAPHIAGIAACLANAPASKPPSTIQPRSNR